MLALFLCVNFSLVLPLYPLFFFFFFFYFSLLSSLFSPLSSLNHLSPYPHLYSSYLPPLPPPLPLHLCSRSTYICIICLFSFIHSSSLIPCHTYIKLFYCLHRSVKKYIYYIKKIFFSTFFEYYTLCFFL